jgi:hypothetical protein
MAKDDAVAGKGFRLTGDDEMDEVEEMVSVRVRRACAGIPVPTPIP